MYSSSTLDYETLLTALRLAIQSNDGLYPQLIDQHERKYELCSRLAHLSLESTNPKVAFNALCILGTLASSYTF